MPASMSIARSSVQANDAAISSMHTIKTKSMAFDRHKSAISFELPVFHLRSELDEAHLLDWLSANKSLLTFPDEATDPEK